MVDPRIGLELGQLDCYLPIELSGNNGGAKRDRTADLLLARQALSQLSYGPIFTPKSEEWLRGLLRSLFGNPGTHFMKFYMVGPSGLEPPTSPLSGVRSNQLS